MKPKSKKHTADGTYLYLNRDNNLQKFILNFQQYLKKKLPVKKLPDGSEFYDCGRNHRWPGSGFKPFQHLEVFCEKKGLDDYEVRDMLEDHFDREIVCECQVLNNEQKIRKEALRRQFGVDFGIGEVGLWINEVLQKPFLLKIRSGFNLYDLRLRDNNFFRFEKENG